MPGPCPYEHLTSQDYRNGQHRQCCQQDSRVVFESWLLASLLNDRHYLQHMRIMQPDRIELGEEDPEVQYLLGEIARVAETGKRRGNCSRSLRA